MLLKHILDGFAKYYRSVIILAQKEQAGSFYMLLDCLYSWVRYGCVLNQYVDGKFYLRKSFQRRKILTYRKWSKIVETFNDKRYTHYLENKSDFNKFFADKVGRSWLNTKQMSLEDFVSFVRNKKEVIVKPVSDWEGNGVHIVKTPDVRDKKTVGELYEKLSKDELLIEEVITQHPEMVFGNKSVNTIRVYTVYDNNELTGFVFKTTLRVGVGDSIVDNSHSGGCAYEVDINTGIIDSPHWSHNYAEGFIHPGTSICMLGIKIPHWEKVLEICVEAANRIPQVRFIGWDVAIMRDGPVLIEGNHDPDLDMVEFVGHFGYYNTIMNHLR